MESIENDEEKILKFISEASNENDYNFEEHIKNISPILARFLSSNDDHSVCLQVLQFFFNGSFPVISMDSAYVLLQDTVSSLCKISENTLEGITDIENMSESLLLDLIVCLELCQAYLLFLNTQSSLESNFTSFMVSTASTMRATLKQPVLCEKWANSKEDDSGDIASRCLIILLDCCSQLSDAFMKVRWFTQEPDNETTELMSSVVDILSEIAHCLSCSSQLRISVKAWKVVVHFLQRYPEQIRKGLRPQYLARNLFGELKESLFTLKSFNLESSLLMVVDTLSNEESEMFNRVLKRGIFVSKILFLVSKCFRGCLREAAFEFVCVVRLLLRFSMGTELDYLPQKFKTLVQEKLCSGVIPCLSTLITDESFLKVISDWDENFEKKASVMFKEDLEEVKERYWHWNSFLFLLNAVVKVLQQDNSSPENLEAIFNICINKIFYTIPYCEKDLFTIIQPFDDFNQPDFTGGQSLYFQTLVSISSLALISRKSCFRSTEKILFRNIFHPCLTVNMLASDLICGISRSGSVELRESYCSILSDFLRNGSSENGDFMTSALISRILALVSPAFATDLLLRWSEDGKSNKFNLAKVIFFLNDDKMEIDAVLRFFFRDIDSFLGTPISAKHYSKQDVQHMVNSLDTLSLCLGNPLVAKSDRFLTIRKTAISQILDLLSRLPRELHSCTAIKRILSSCFAVLISLSADMTKEDLFGILSLCKCMLNYNSSNDSLRVGFLLSRCAVKGFDAAPVLHKPLLNLVCDLFVRLLSHPDAFVRKKQIENFVFFARNSNDDQVFKLVTQSLNVEIKEIIINQVKRDANSNESENPADVLQSIVEMKAFAESLSDHYTTMPSSLDSREQRDTKETWKIEKFAEIFQKETRKLKHFLSSYVDSPDVCDKLDKYENNVLLMFNNLLDTS